MDVKVKPIKNVQTLIAHVEEFPAVDFLFFWGHRIPKGGSLNKSCLSQWYPASFVLDGVSYLTAEHFMMAEKARLFDATEIEKQILEESDPSKVKSLGRRIKNYDDEIWKAHRFEAVTKGNVAKFSQNPRLRNFLERTENQILVEASPVDFIWGIGLASGHPDASKPARWLGLNLLGFALMEARTQILT